MLAWGFSVRRRIIHLLMRRCLTGISALTIFWFLVRTLKFHFVSAPAAIRMLWYLFYVPILFIPLLAVYVSLSLGKSER